jgi:hypothetical protein
MVISKKNRIWNYAFAVAVGFAVTSCGDSASVADEEDDEAKYPTSSNGGTDAAAVSELSDAFPGSLALTVFPTESSASLALGEAAAETFDPNGMKIKDKVAEQQKIANGEASSCLPTALSKQFVKGEDETCYEFDQDMIYGTNDSGQTTPKFLGNQNGKASTGEACMVSYMRDQVSDTIAMVDQTLGFGMAAICQHKKDNPDASLPAVGETVDLAPAMTGLLGKKLTVSSASLERLADNGDYPVFRILIKVSKEGDPKRTIGIIHSPNDDKNETYVGTMYTVMEGEPKFKSGMPAQANASEQYRHISISYKRSVVDGENHMSAELRTAKVEKSLSAKAITDAGVLDFNVGTEIATGTVGSTGYGNFTGFSDNEQNKAVDSMTLVAFDVNPDTNEGTLAYWKNPGGRYYENARGFNIAISENTDGTLAGCATSGAASTDMGKGISIRRYLNEKETDLTLEAKGFYHPFMSNPSGSGTDDKGSFKTATKQSGQIVKWYVPLISDATIASKFVTDQNGSIVTRQCFTQNAEGLYEIDAAKITEVAGLELIDTGNTVNNAKFIKLPPPVRAEIKDAKKAE